MNSTSSRPAPTPRRERALVLGGGGSTGQAWLVGVLAGLGEGGLDVTAADLTIGTSAGSTVAAQLGGATPADLFAPIPTETTAAGPGAARPVPNRPAPNHLERTNAVIAAASDAADMRRRMGTAALELEASSDGSYRDRWRATVATRLPSPEWPQRAVLLTAVDADTGEPAVFDRQSGVELVDAVAASCSSVLPYRIGERRYIDGGYRRNENADLASGHERILVLSPFGGRTRHPLAWRMQLAAQVEELQAEGGRVEIVSPVSEALFGSNAMDPSLRPSAARAGHEQGLALAERLGLFWE